MSGDVRKFNAQWLNNYFIKKKEGYCIIMDRLITSLNT